MTLRLWSLAIVFGLACAGGEEFETGVMSIEDLESRMRTLSSDEFEGRAPSSPGEEKTVAYLAQQFQAMGLEPGNDGSYFQDVPLVAVTANGNPVMRFSGPGGNARYAYGPDHVVWSKRLVDATSVTNSDVVFVGFGIVAPEYGWDDYADVDVTGKTVIILVNDPGFHTNDETSFNGSSMTYYGRWTYKYEEAARQGAAAALVVHETRPAAYPWDVVESSWTGPQFDLVPDDRHLGRVVVEGWVSYDTATELFARVGSDLSDMEQQALDPGFVAVDLQSTMSLSFTSTLEYSNSKNVVATLPGADRADEYVIYVAHWDHFGMDTSLVGDQIYNGALDNASGTAGMLEIAAAFAALDRRPARSVMFLAVTAEEQGLLGSAYYGQSPIVPTNKTVAAFNLDGLNLLGPMNDITVVGYGNSELDDYVEGAASEQGRTVRGDPEPEKGYYYRSDHFSLAKVGVPALYTDAGTDHVEYGEEWSAEQRAAYVSDDYHKPSDEYKDTWDLRGAIADLQLLFAIGQRIASSNDWPNWREGTEFRALRDADLSR